MIISLHSSRIWRRAISRDGDCSTRPSTALTSDSRQDSLTRLSHTSLSHTSLSHKSLTHKSLTHKSLTHKSLSHKSLSRVAHTSRSHKSITPTFPICHTPTFPPCIPASLHSSQSHDPPPPDAPHAILCLPIQQLELRASLNRADGYTRTLMSAAIDLDPCRTVALLTRLSPRQVAALHPPTRALVRGLLKRIAKGSEGTLVPEGQFSAIEL